jgi:hypothetical protein
LRELFDYVEPSNKNLGCFSYRIHSLLLRACVEVEANCKAILKENGYVKPGGNDLNMGDYRKLEKTHFLSGYQVAVPDWHGQGGLRTPFLPWATGQGLTWYQAYNAAKHDRHSAFETATFEHLIDAVCGLLVILSAQFETNDFGPGNDFLCAESPDDMESGIGAFFRVRFPKDWPEDLRYDFNWQQLKDQPNPFQIIDYSQID